MAESPVQVYKRRPRTPLSELSWNRSDADVDPESTVSLLASDDDEDENSRVLTRSRTRNSHPPVTKRRKGSSATSGEEYNIANVTRKWVGVTFGRKDNGQGKRAKEASPLSKGTSPHVRGTPRRDQTEKQSAVAGQGTWLHSPVEFVREKQAMFAEIDSFELETEEESRDDKQGGKRPQSIVEDGEVVKSSKSQLASAWQSGTSGESGPSGVAGTSSDTGTGGEGGTG